MSMAMLMQMLMLMLEGPEIPTCVGLPYRKVLLFSVQVERWPAKAFSYTTWEMATGAPAWVPTDQCHLIRHAADGY